MIRLIATDLDDTLLQADHRSISERTKAALAAAAEAGILTVPVSGRQPYSIAAIVTGTSLARVGVGANGAVAKDLRTRETLFEEQVDVAAQTHLTHEMMRLFPGLTALSVREGGDLYVAQHGYRGPQDPGVELAAWQTTHVEADLDEVLAAPSVKLVLRHPDVDVHELLEAARDLDVEGCHPTSSGADFLEVARAGVTKATGIAHLCERWGVDASEVLAFGDNINDVELLTWAGRSCAVDNGRAEARAAADEVTAANVDDGVAQVIERLLG